MEDLYVITISHLLGCGGAYVGKALSEKLSIPFIDSQILKKVADSLGLPEKDIEKREEKQLSFWDAFVRGEAFNIPLITYGENIFPLIPTDEELYILEKKYIEEVANEHSCVILGRRGNYILRAHKRHLKVFVYADLNFRTQRISELYNVPSSEAVKLINKNDKERREYIKTFTKRDMLNLEFYDICVDASSLGMDNAVKVVQSALDAKLGVK